MSLAEDDRIKEVGELQSATAPAFDDIYVPGIGVRGALSDDAEEGSDFRSRVAQGWGRGAELVYAWVSQTVGNFRRVGSLLAVKITRISIGSQVAISRRPKFLTQLTNWRVRYLPQTERSLSNVVQRAVSKLRDGTRVWALSVPRREAVRQIGQKTRARLLRVSHICCTQIQRVRQFPLPLPPFPEDVARNLRRTSSFLRRAAGNSKARLRINGNYQGMLRTLASAKSDLQTLRRAAAPLAILLAMVVFVIQQIVVVTKR